MALAAVCPVLVFCELAVAVADPARFARGVVSAAETVTVRHPRKAFEDANGASAIAYTHAS